MKKRIERGGTRILQIFADKKENSVLMLSPRLAHQNLESYGDLLSLFFIFLIRGNLLNLRSSAFYSFQVAEVLRNHELYACHKLWQQSKNFHA